MMAGSPTSGTRPAASHSHQPTGGDGRATAVTVPAALIILSAVPVAAGTLRLLQLAGGPDLMPADHRFPALPAALIVHVVGAILYVLLGSLQFVPRFRRRHLTWHRRTGRVLTLAGLLVATSAVWMTVLYAPKPGTGDLLYVLRVLFGAAMVICLLLGFTAIRRRDSTAHRAWMIRAYAIGLAAGTQAFTEGVADAVVGTSDLTGDLAKGAGWMINLAVAEWVIRRTSGSARAHS